MKYIGAEKVYRSGHDEQRPLRSADSCFELCHEELPAGIVFGNQTHVYDSDDESRDGQNEGQNDPDQNSMLLSGVDFPGSFLYGWRVIYCRFECGVRV